MSTGRKQVWSIVAVALLVSLAGCGAMSGLTGPTISDTEATVVDGYPAIVFDYDTDEHSTALLEGPDGEIVDETRIEPAYNTSELFFDDPREGEYRILIRQGGETVASKTLEFVGPDAEIEHVEPVWSDNTLESVKVTVHNDGDLPLWVEKGGYVVSGESVKTGIRESVDTGEMKTIEIVPGYGEQITVEETGEVTGSVSIESPHGLAFEEFTRTIEPPELEIVSVNPKWSGSVLEEVEVTVRNTGDVPTRANVSVEHKGDEVGYDGGENIEPGETVEFVATDGQSIFEAESGGVEEFEVRVNSEYEVARSGFSKEVEGADVSIESMSPTWESGRLTKLTFSASNNGEVEAEYPVTVTVNGETVEEGTVTIPAESTQYFTAFDTLSYREAKYVALSGGTFKVTIRTETDDGPVTESDVVEFDGKESTFSSVDATFYDSYDTDGFELSSVSFSLQNDGDVPIMYDTIEVSIGGTSRSESLYYTESLLPGKSTNEYLNLLEGIVVDGGSHELTIRLTRNGETVISKTVTVSTG